MVADNLNESVVIGGGGAITASPWNAAVGGASNDVPLFGGLPFSDGVPVVDLAAISAKTSAQQYLAAGNYFTFPDTLFYLYVTGGKIGVYMRETSANYLIGKASVGHPLLLTGSHGLLYGYTEQDSHYYLNELLPQGRY